MPTSEEDQFSVSAGETKQGYAWIDIEKAEHLRTITIPPQSAVFDTETADLRYRSKAKVFGGKSEKYGVEEVDPGLCKRPLCNRGKGCFMIGQRYYIYDDGEWYCRSWRIGGKKAEERWVLFGINATQRACCFVSASFHLEFHVLGCILLRAYNLSRPRKPKWDTIMV